MTQTHRIWSLAQAVIDKAGALGATIATAESCTGGMIAAALTDVPGSSVVVDRAFVTYSNEAKIDMLGVPEALIRQHGAVSAQVGRAMAVGALRRSRADITVSVTGIAGPTGGNLEKPVGLVWFGLKTANAPTRVERRVFAQGGRDYVRSKATETALRFLLSKLTA